MLEHYANKEKNVIVFGEKNQTKYLNVQNMSNLTVNSVSIIYARLYELTKKPSVVLIILNYSYNRNMSYSYYYIFALH